MGRSWDYSPLVHGKIALTSDQGIEAPIAAASRGHVEEDETEQHGGHPLILNRPAAIREVKLPIGDPIIPDRMNATGRVKRPSMIKMPPKNSSTPPMPV